MQSILMPCEIYMDFVAHPNIRFVQHLNFVFKLISFDVCFYFLFSPISFHFTSKGNVDDNKFRFFFIVKSMKMAWGSFASSSKWKHFVANK